MCFKTGNYRRVGTSISTRALKDPEVGNSDSMGVFFKTEMAAVYYTIVLSPDLRYEDLGRDPNWWA